MQKIIFIGLFSMLYATGVLAQEQEKETFALMTFVQPTHDSLQLQIVDDSEEFGDVDLENIEAIIERYRVRDGKMDTQSMAKLANDYRLHNKTQEAEYWYAKFIAPDSNTEDILHYAHTLRVNGKCEDAVRWFKHYNSLVEKRKDKVKLSFVKDCIELKNIKITEDVVLTNLEIINSEHLDFAAIPYKEGLVFTSSRSKGSISKWTDRKTKDNFTDLFYTKQTIEGNYNSPIPMNGDLNGRFHDGAASFSSDGQQMFFSRSNSKGKNVAGVINLKIYQATLGSDNSWNDAQELAFNHDDFASCHPSLSPNGMKLYFASDRSGGFGGMDIYVSEKIDGVWQTPANLGPTVNTTSNELFPSIANNGLLFFASNGHEGLGGLDIFVAKKMDIADELSWEARENIGEPFNSEQDDFGFYIKNTEMEGYLTSNRGGGLGGDDIYQWQTTNTLSFFETLASERVFSLVEKNTNMRLYDAVVVVEPIEGAYETAIYRTDKNGNFTHLVPPGSKFSVTISKDGYEGMKEKFTARALSKSEGILVFEMERNSCSLLHAAVSNASEKRALSNIAVTVLNKCTGETEEFVSDDRGRFESCLKCDCEYVVTASKEGYIDVEQIVVASAKNCGKDYPLTMELDLQPIEIRSTKDLKKEVLLKELDSDLNTNLKEGNIIALKNLYYDFNKASIRLDATVDLDHVADLLQLYPTMQIELGSHTDARGSSKYNQKLSDRRAFSAVEYLIEKGITSYRLVGKGYGESQPVNHCKDGVNCTDEEHQQNRRTEVKIIKM